MVLQSSSSEPVGPYDPDEHFKKRFMSLSATLVEDPTIYHPLTEYESIA